MIASFRNRATDTLFHGIASKAARSTSPAGLRAVARRKLDLLNEAHDLRDLRVPPGTAWKHSREPGMDSTASESAIIFGSFSASGTETPTM